MKRRPSPPPQRPLPPAPLPAEFIYGQDPLTGALTPEPVAVRGGVDVPIGRIPEYLEAYGLELDSEWEGGPLFELGGIGWVLVVKRVG